MPYKNKADQAAAARRHYELNKEKMIARAIAHKKKQQELIREYLREVKSAPCTDCKQSYPHYVMQFDHTSDDKLFNVADHCKLSKTLKSVKEEIAKCELVCANCHSVRTWRRRTRSGEVPH